MRRHQNLAFALTASCVLHALALAGLVGFSVLRVPAVMVPAFGSDESLVVLTLVPAPPSPASVPQPRTAAIIPATVQAEKPVAAPSPEEPLPEAREALPLPAEPPKLPPAAPAAQEAPAAPAPGITFPQPVPAVEAPPVVNSVSREAPGVESGAVYETDIRAVYPMSARMRGEEGVVTVLVALNSSSRAENVEVCRSSGYPALDRAALQAAKRGRFKVRGRQPPESQNILLTFRFRLLEQM